MDYWDLQELACVILNLNYEEIINNNKEEEIDNSLYNKFGIDMQQFDNIVESLVPLTYPLQSPLTKEWYNCLGIKEEGIWRAIIKIKIKNN